MGQQDMVHGARGGADVAQAGGMDAHEMRQPGHAPGFVDRGDGGHAVADAAGDDFGEIGKAQRQVSRLVQPPMSASAEGISQ